MNLHWTIKTKINCTELLAFEIATEERAREKEKNVKFINVHIQGGGYKYDGYDEYDGYVKKMVK